MGTCEKGTFLREHNEKGINFDISSIRFRVYFAILCSSISTTLASGSALPGIVLQIRVNVFFRDCVRQNNILLVKMVENLIRYARM